MKSAGDRSGALLKADTAPLVIAVSKDGKLRVSSSSWMELLVVLPGQHLDSCGETPTTA